MTKTRVVILFAFLGVILTLVALNWGRVAPDPHHTELIISDEESADWEYAPDNDGDDLQSQVSLPDDAQ